MERLSTVIRTVYMTAVRAYDKLCGIRLLNLLPATEESLIEYACARAQGCNLLAAGSQASSPVHDFQAYVRTTFIPRRPRP
jgi:hypothetical protein